MKQEVVIGGRGRREKKWCPDVSSSGKGASKKKKEDTEGKVERVTIRREGEGW